MKQNNKTTRLRKLIDENLKQYYNHRKETQMIISDIKFITNQFTSVIMNKGSSKFPQR